MGNLETIYAAIWVDNAFGPLTLRHDTKEQAIESAKAMAIKGADKISYVRAVELTPANELLTLWEA